MAEWQGLPIRPLRDRVRTALFDIIRELIPDAEVLDLFAGTGAVGLEALSRGAARATMVERSQRVARLIHDNVRRLGYEERVRVLTGDALHHIHELAQRGERFDVVFVGAPYGTPLARNSMHALARIMPLEPEAVVIAEVHTKETLDDRYGPLQRELRRAYGETRLDFFRFVPKRNPD